MLKLLVVLATAYACVAHIQTDVRTADKTFLTRQKAVYSLFWHVDQPTAVYPELYQIARSWSIEDHIDSFTNPTVVHNFVHIYKQGLIHRDAVFSILHPEHLEEALALYQLLHCAKDFDTFYNTAVWARFNVNERLFTYVLSIVVIHRPDTQHMRTPPFPEIVPHFFFNNEVIQAAHSVKMGDTSVKKAIGIKYHEGGDVVIHANYSGWYIVRDNVEDKLNYFTEDIGLNSNYFTMVNDYPFFLNSQDYNLHKEIRGEQYYYTHKQLLARYYLERLSNDLGEIEHVNWHAPIRAGYYPTINHHNGLPFPHRQAWSFVPNRLYPTVTEVEAIESRIHAAIDSGYILDENNKQVNIYTPEGFNILANIVEGNADSVNVRYYGSFDHLCRHVIGFSTQSVDKHHVMPSALEIMSTSMRDPGFYRIYKKILNYFLKYKEHLPKYTHDDVAFPGVKIESVAVDKLLTYFEHHDTIVSNGVPVTSQKDAETTVIKVRQHRLNHKPFTYHITVNSEKNTKALVRVFIGPKFNEHGHELHLADNWMNFVEMDQWVVELKAGINKIERSSHESVYTVPDEQSSDVFWKKITKAIEAGETYTYTPQISGFPDRLVLPKGKKEGLPVKLFVYVSPFDETTAVKVESPVWGTTVTDGKPMGYPLDRPVVPHVINVPNALFKDVVIFHKHVEELNLTI